MKKLIGLLSVGVLSFGLVSAYGAGYNGEEFAEPMLQRDLNFSAQLVNDKVWMEWDQIAMPNGEQFLWYKVMKGAATAVYPDQAAIEVRTNVADTTATDSQPGPNQHYRVCLITKKDSGQKGRYCSEAVYVSKSSTATTTTSTTSQSTDISGTMKNKIDTVIDNFLYKLDTKYGDDNDRKIAIIETVMKKVDELATKKPHLASVLNYINELLDDAIELLEIDSVFGIE